MTTTLEGELRSITATWLRQALPAELLPTFFDITESPKVGRQEEQWIQGEKGPSDSQEVEFHKVGSTLLWSS